MTRVGWIVLGGILLIAALFASMLSFGGGTKFAARKLPKVSSESAGIMREGRNGLPALAVPVAGVVSGQLVDSWGQARGQGRGHHGTDIMAPGGTPVLAAAPGTVEKLFQSERGGITVYQRSPDRRWTFYYAHLRGYAPGIHEGQRVRTGDLLGFVGDTGDAGPGNTHLHFSAARLRPDQRWWEDVNAFPMLTGP